MGADDMRADDMRGDVDFDTAVNEAWARYRHLLAALLSDLDDGQELIVEQNLEIPEFPRGAELLCLRGPHRVHDRRG